MSVTLTKNIISNGYNAFNKAGNGIANASWDDWNAGPNAGGKYGYAGVRATQSVRYAFVYRFKTPTWSGTPTRLTLKFRLQEELGNNRTIRASVTTTDPTSSTTLYTDQNLPSDSGRLADGVVTVAASTSQEYTLQVNLNALTQNKTYYLVLSPNTSSGSNYATVYDATLTGFVTYEATPSDVSAPGGFFGSAMTINMTNDGLQKTLTYSFEGASGTIGTTTAGSISWTPPASLMSRIPDSTSGTCTITCTTEAGSTTCTCMLSVPDTIKPSFSAASKTLVNDNPTVAAWGIYLQNYSKIRVAFTAAANYSTITSWRIDAGAVSFSAENISSSAVNVSELSDILTAAGTYTVSITVTDARGRSTTVSLGSYTIQTYGEPTAVDVTIYRCLQDGTKDESEGTYLYAKATRSYTQVGSNTCTMYFQYKEKSAETYTSVQLTDNTAVIVGSGQIDVLKTYTTRIYIEDSLCGTYYYEGVSTQAVAFNLKPDPDGGAAFGGYSNEKKVLELMNGWRLRVHDTEKIVVWDDQEENEITLKTLLEGGGGGGGTSDYNALSNKPSIAGVTLSGNKGMASFGLVTSVNAQSTDLQFPSAKLLFDICGDIESLLAALIGGS